MSHCFSSVLIACLISLTVFGHPSQAQTRQWKSLNGDVTINGDLVASNETTAVVKRKGSGRLVAVELSELSAADREFVRERAAGKKPQETGDPKKLQTWTSRDGMKMQASVVAYGQKQYILGSTRGRVTINGKAFSNLDPLHQAIALKVLSKLESTPMDDEADLRRFVSLLLGKPKTYQLEGVLMELASGDQIAVPFFLFSDKDLVILKAGWESWQKAEEADRNREDLMMRSEARDYQQAYAQSQDYQQMEMLKLNMLAARTGLTSIWEVQLKPNPGVFGRPIAVMVPARNSQIATQMVLPNYPGYSLIGVRRASRR